MTDVDTLVQPHPPLPEHLAKLAPYKAVERLEASLVAAGVTEGAARATANSTIDPNGFRRGLQSPMAFRTPFGDLLAVFTRVWSPAVVPFATNMRVSSDLGYAVAGDVTSRPLGPVVSAQGDVAEVSTTAPDRQTVESVLGSVAHAVAVDNDLSEDIGLNGAQEPIILVPMTFAHSDGTESVTVLSAADGSSRVTAAQRNLGITPDTVAYRYAPDPAQMRARIGRLVALVDGDLDELDRDELIQLNSLTLPAFVVVGFRAVTPGQGDFVRAVNARVGAIHVARPRPWSDGARLDAQLDAVLDALHATGRLSDLWYSYYSGSLTLDEAAAESLPPHPDVRAADLAVDMQNSRNVRTINRALRSLSLSSPTIADRAAVAAEGALRAFRNDLPSAKEVGAARNLLAHLYAAPVVRSGGAEEVVGEIDTVLRRAIAGDLFALRDLQLLAFYWLARHRLVRRTTRGGELDRRDVVMLLEQMAGTAHGLRQLYRIVADGRSGIVPRRVNEANRFLVRPGTKVRLTVDEAWLRKTWPPANSSGSSESDGEEDSQPETPDAEFVRRQGQIKQGALDLQAEVEALAKPCGPDGVPLLESRRLTSAFVTEVTSTLNLEVIGPLLSYRARRATTEDEAS